MGPKLSSVRIFLHSQKFLSMNSHFAKCTTSSKCIRRWLNNSDIPQSSCFCEVYKNASFLAKGINSTLKSSDMLSPTTHGLVETHTCNWSSKDCMLRNCPECLKPGLSLSDFKADIDLISFLHWQQVKKKDHES